MVKEVLSLDGYEVLTAISGEEALERLEAGLVDIVLTDNNMPGMQGLDLLAEVRERWPDVPVIIMTGYGNMQVSMRAHELGAAGYLLKPFEDIALISREVEAVARRMELARREQRK